MAWNEPGGSGDKDPWGGQKKNSGDGPPDLDEVVKNLTERFGRLFGGGGNSGGDSSGSPRFGGAAVSGVLILILGIWIVSGFYIVEEGNRGVVQQFGAYNETTEPGLRWYAPIVQRVDIVSVDRIRSIDLGNRTDDSLMLTQDENIIDIEFSVQYQVKNAENYLFRTRDPDETLRQATESAIREIIGQRKMDFVLTGGRAEVATLALDLSQKILDRYESGLLITSLNMQDAQPPEQVQGAFADAIKAREDKVRLKNEAEAYSNDILPRAEGAAKRQVLEAEGYKLTTIAEATGEAARFNSIRAEYERAPEITRKRLYLETMESVLASSSKVVIDSQSDNNLIYLPLDKMLPQTLGTNAQPQSTPPNQAGNSQRLPLRTGNRTGNDTRSNLRGREVR